jgi:hypothetical protein
MLSVVQESTMDSTTMPPSGEVATDETKNLISADKVVGTAVYNRQGEHLGSVHGLMINKLNGQIVHAIMSFGGFLGMGESYHPLPWQVLTYDPRLDGYVVDLDRSLLKAAPSFTGSNAPDWDTYGKSVNEYYGVPPVSS